MSTSEIARHIGSTLNLAPNADLIRPLRKALKQLPGRVPSARVLNGILFNSRPMTWPQALQVGMLIGEYPDWLINCMGTPASGTAQARLLLGALAKREDLPQKSSPRSWLTLMLSEQGMKAGAGTIDKWFSGQRRVSQASRQALASAMGVNEDELPKDRRSRNKGKPVAAEVQDSNSMSPLELWPHAKDLFNAPQIQALAKLSFDPMQHGYIFRIRLAMIPLPGNLPSEQEISAALATPGKLSWNTCLKFTGLLGGTPDWALPSDDRCSEFAKCTLKAIAHTIYAPHNEDAFKWLAERLKKQGASSTRKTIIGWLSGKAKPNRSSLTALEIALGLSTGTLLRAIEADKVPDRASGAANAPLDAENPLGEPASVSQKPPSVQSAIKIVAEQGMNELAARLLFMLFPEEDAAGFDLEQEVQNRFQYGTGLNLPASVCSGWLTGECVPSSLELDLLGASLSLPDWWLHRGVRRPAKTERSRDRRELAGKLRMYMKASEYIQNARSNRLQGASFSQRLRLALTLRGAISSPSVPLDEIQAAVQYLMSMKFSLEHDRHGDIKTPPLEDVQLLATRCGVEFGWLMHGGPSEHSIIRAQFEPD